MKKLFIPLVCVFSSIALILMLIGIILGICHIRLFQIRPLMWYFSSVNFILFAILLEFARHGPEPDQKP
jgi:hypothetical protein